MGNNQNNRNGNNNNRGGYSVPQRLSIEELRQGLANYVNGLNVNGVYCIETNDTLMALAETAISDLGLIQVDRVMIKPSMRRGDNSTLDGISAAVSFDLTSGDDIVSTAAGNDGKGMSGMDIQQNILWKNSGIKKFSGDFETSDRFRQIMAPIAAEFTDNDDIIVRKPPANYGKNVGVVVVDFMELLRMTLRMKDDDPYNFSITNATRLDRSKYQFGLLIYIDNSTRRRKGRKNNSVDYQGLTDYLFS